MRRPEIPASVFVAESAVVLGDVRLGEHASVYHHAVLRADNDVITIGEGTNVQDGCVLHVDAGLPLAVGRGCTVGHGAILHGCTIGDNALIGMGAIVLNGAVIGDNCLVAAGALVPQGAVIPEGSLVMGSPARVKRPLTPEEIDNNRAAAELYLRECAALLQEDSMEPLTLFVRYTCLPGQREAFLLALAEAGVVDAIRAEEGCLRYDYYLSVQDADRVLLVEKWAHADDQKRHMAQPHMARLAELKARYVAETALGDEALL